MLNRNTGTEVLVLGSTWLIIGKIGWITYEFNTDSPLGKDKTFWNLKGFSGDFSNRVFFLLISYYFKFKQVRVVSAQAGASQ